MGYVAGGVEGLVVGRGCLFAAGGEERGEMGGRVGDEEEAPGAAAAPRDSRTRAASCGGLGVSSSRRRSSADLRARARRVLM